MENGKLTLIATPIGNLGDLTFRAEEALKLADFWIVEDTRISGKLQSHFGIRKPMSVCNEHTSGATIAKYVAEIVSGKSAALITDGGSPVVSDPGTLVVQACVALGIEIEATPGPSAPILALTLSGFFGQRFAFLGFLPRKPGPMKKEFSFFKDSPLTLIAFESQHRIENLLFCAYEALGARNYAICRELTKVHQQVFREKLPIIPTEKQVPRKGEFTIVIEGVRRIADE